MSPCTYLRRVVAAAHGGSGCERLRPYPTTQDTTVRERTVESRERCTTHRPSIEGYAFLGGDIMQAVEGGERSFYEIIQAVLVGHTAWPCPQPTRTPVTCDDERLPNIPDPRSSALVGNSQLLLSSAD